jgi:hypothetical protein
MLHEFLTRNRIELIVRCREKAARRFKPSDASEITAPMAHGVPLFMQQLVETLRMEQFLTVRDVARPAPAPAPAHTEVGRAAALHGAELLRLGYSIDQVVHEYGDVCQSVTELAVKQEVHISADEFRTLNRCLDNAIAGAVTSFGKARQDLNDGQAETLRRRLRSFANEQQRLVDVAIESISAIRTDHGRLIGSAGTLLIHTLNELRSLADRTLPEVRPMPPKVAVAPN